jgi:HAD superfamily hydrolase (TIGR01549 family)
LPWKVPEILRRSIGFVTAVVFDIGETILDRTREHAAWAAFFEVPAHTFSAVFGAMIARGEKVSAVIEFFAPGQTFDELSARRRRAGGAIAVDEEDLYPDVRRTFATLRESGYVVGVAGNQPASVSDELRRLELGADFIASSTEWGIAKPTPAFFERAAREAGATLGDTIYVGDQLDNDVVAPREAGLRAVRILRGPWGLLTRDPVIESSCLGVIRSLDELPSILADGGRDTAGS